MLHCWPCLAHHTYALLPAPNPNPNQATTITLSLPPPITILTHHITPRLPPPPAPTTHHPPPQARTRLQPRLQWIQQLQQVPILWRLQPLRLWRVQQGIRLQQGLGQQLQQGVGQVSTCCARTQLPKPCYVRQLLVVSRLWIVYIHRILTVAQVESKSCRFGLLGAVHRHTFLSGH
jgi:hypothetical protein